jgi:hypothetical protein
MVTFEAMHIHNLFHSATRQAMNSGRDWNIHKHVSHSEASVQRGVLEIHNAMFNTEYRSIGRRRESNPQRFLRRQASICASHINNTNIELAS